jgi:hypothetical protein
MRRRLLEGGRVAGLRSNRADTKLEVAMLQMAHGRSQGIECLLCSAYGQGAVGEGLQWGVL